jgi:hypothetical protein
MKKKDWGNAVWFLFHTLAYKLKPEYSAETSVLYSHIVNICANLPCPDCQEHATMLLARTNRAAVTSSREALNQFLFTFHNLVNKRIQTPLFAQEALSMYATVNTKNVVDNFMRVMNTNMNNSRLMMDSFRRQNYMNAFTTYIKANGYKYNG